MVGPGWFGGWLAGVLGKKLKGAAGLAGDRLKFGAWPRLMVYENEVVGFGRRSCHSGTRASFAACGERQGTGDPH